MKTVQWFHGIFFLKLEDFLCFSPENLYLNNVENLYTLQLKQCQI